MQSSLTFLPSVINPGKGLLTRRWRIISMRPVKRLRQRVVREQKLPAAGSNHVNPVRADEIVKYRQS